MPEVTLDIEPELHSRLTQWAREQQRPLPALLRDILIAGERTRDRYEPTMTESTRWIRMCRDGGCGLCEELEWLFATGKTATPIHD